MEKKHSQKINRYLIVIIVFVLIPIILYLVIFGKNGLSFKSINWSEFGSFIGGYGTFVFSAINLYFLIETAYTINHLDEERNTKNKIESVKPFLSVSTFLSLINNYVVVELNNDGLGPSIVREIKYSIDGKSYKDIDTLIFDNLSISNLQPKYRANTLVNGSVVPLNSKIEILYLEIDENSNLTFEKKNIERAIQNRIVTELNKIKIDITYTDIHNYKEYVYKNYS